MELEFVNRNVDLQRLVNEIKRGFVAFRGFKILGTESKNGSFVLAFSCNSVPGIVKVMVEGVPEKFSVNFCLKEDRLLSLISYIGIPFGTGYLYLRNVKRMENFRKLEKEFFEFLLRVIVLLEGSANKRV